MPTEDPFPAGTVERMGEHAISRFGHVDLEDMPEDLRERIGAIAEKSGFVPNVFLALARRPRELRAFLDYHDALMDSGDGLSKAERELIVVATSAANHCTYCVVAHGAILRVRAKDAEIADRVSTNPYAVELSPRERAIVDLALLIAADSAALTEAELDDARAAGLSEDEIWDVGAITALFALSNRMAHLTALSPNPEFFLMGRLPR
ncbi:peroxidase-related enzyme [Pseudonocardia ailaonensis]|uniref:Peroxidase-related enzyme n=2 Tax=Pseudonocardia ailaonensis TaxID=367279 RepID=A0ABN2NR32_9PSEU